MLNERGKLMIDIIGICIFYILYFLLVRKIVFYGLNEGSISFKIFSLIQYLCFTLTTLWYIQYNVLFLVGINLILCFYVDHFIVKSHIKNKVQLIILNNIYIILLDTVLYGVYYCISMPSKYEDIINGIVDKNNFFIFKYFKSFVRFIDISYQKYFTAIDDSITYPFQNIVGSIIFFLIIAKFFDCVIIFPQNNDDDSIK